MPSINEVWEQALQINANLATIHNDLLDLEACCAATNSRLDQLVVRSTEANNWLAEIRGLTANGFAAVTAGLAGIQVRQEVLIQMTAIQLQQNESILCVLENISMNTCDLVNQSHQQTSLQGNIADAAGDVSHMTATVHPDAALALQREMERQEALEACCPPDPVPDPCAYQPCDRPKIPKFSSRELTTAIKAKRTKVNRVRETTPPQ